VSSTLGVVGSVVAEPSNSHAPIYSYKVPVPEPGSFMLNHLSPSIGETGCDVEISSVVAPVHV